ncbi:hypothetical protein [Collimonas sp. PA-H2]|uniref:hypothetical protein n=1 Tax=Collimonas sp. PA-H2 TaxID=1881062 RepID=UPI0018EBAD30|nr:hypothetical protein [Collimonas sp. PA-H2]
MQTMTAQEVEMVSGGLIGGVGVSFSGSGCLSGAIGGAIAGSLGGFAGMGLGAFGGCLGGGMTFHLLQ